MIFFKILAFLLLGLVAFIVVTGAVIIIWYMWLLHKTGYLELFLKRELEIEIEKEKKKKNGKKNG